METFCKIKPYPGFLFVVSILFTVNNFWGIPSSDGIPNGVADLFFFFFLLGFLPPAKMAFPEAKHSEGNLVLT